tara:strand:+ start:290 stop:436 length:147 start_codon:yes stop_codon:yes gene_type:complete
MDNFNLEWRIKFWASQRKNKIKNKIKNKNPCDHAKVFITEKKTGVENE